MLKFRIMKKKILIGLGAVLLLFILWSIYGLFFATPVSPPATVSYDQNGLAIDISYSQPSKKGRLIFGEEAAGALQPYGKYWRLGANAATEVTFNKDVRFGGIPVEAGTYRMYAIPGEDSFEVILNRETDVFFGAIEPDHDLDLVTVEAPVEQPETAVETFTISFKSLDQGVSVDFAWDQTLFSVPVSLQ